MIAPLPVLLEFLPGPSSKHYQNSTTQLKPLLQRSRHLRAVRAAQSGAGIPSDRRLEAAIVSLRDVGARGLPAVQLRVQETHRLRPTPPDPATTPPPPPTRPPPPPPHP